MTVSRLRLQHRIVIPFVLIALATTAAAAWVALSASADALRARVQAQLISGASVAARADYAFNPAILRSLQQVLSAEIVTIGPDGTILASSVGDDRTALAAAVVRGVAAVGGGAASEPIVVPVDCGAPCLVVYRGLDGRAGSGVALIADTSELASTMRSVARTIVLAALLSVLVMVLVSQAVVRRVTSPLDRLVRFARELSPRESLARAPVGNDEVGALAEAFNGMLERLEQSREALVRSEKLALAGLFAARVAHDIRNPLSSIKMQTQLLKARSHQDAETTATLGDVLHDISQVESVISDLLELARPGYLAREVTPPNAVVREALQQLAAQFSHRRIVVDTRLGDRLPVLQLDAPRLKQALLNVLVNASEALPTGGRITVSTRANQSGGVELEICDDGIGVDPAMIEKVFDPFVSTKRDGVGLGLVNTKAVVEGHGGTIRLEARQPKGVCVTVTLPGEGHG
jgi:signal transduction histidine kinase